MFLQITAETLAIIALEIESILMTLNDKQLDTTLLTAH